MRSVEELVRVAIEARALAYAPYSGYRVGAAIETDSGEIVSGCNVENLSYGATICAERTAVTRMIASNLGTKVLKIAVASKDGVTPCGICLQVLNEFVDDADAVVVCVSEDGSAEEFKFRQLMPHAFQSSSVRRTESPCDEV